ncbi:Zinc finger MYM-type protein 6, partial [Stegodyphus mimosarum]
MTEDINDRLIEKIKRGEFELSLRIINNMDAHLISHVRFIDGNNIKKDLLFCKNIIKAQDLFEISDTFLSENNLNWPKCIGIGTHRTRSMSVCCE